MSKGQNTATPLADAQVSLKTFQVQHRFSQRHSLMGVYSVFMFQFVLFFNRLSYSGDCPQIFYTDNAHLDLILLPQFCKC